MMEFEDHFLGTKQLVKVSIIQCSFVETCYRYKLDVYLNYFGCKIVDLKFWGHLS